MAETFADFPCFFTGTSTWFASFLLQYPHLKKNLSFSYWFRFYGMSKRNNVCNTNIWRYPKRESVAAKRLLGQDPSRILLRYFSQNWISCSFIPSMDNALNSTQINYWFVLKTSIFMRRKSYKWYLCFVYLVFTTVDFHKIYIFFVRYLRLYIFSSMPTNPVPSYSNA